MEEIELDQVVKLRGSPEMEQIINFVKSVNDVYKLVIKYNGDLINYAYSEDQHRLEDRIMHNYILLMKEEKLTNEEAIKLAKKIHVIITAKYTRWYA